MNSTTTARVLSLEEAAEFAPEQVVGLSQELAAAQQQVDVFKPTVANETRETDAANPLAVAD